ncbi:MAG: membrane protein insertase YidC [Mogibacterium sp.]|nr:membrane protein insertase YidC [Mogibacterium sp.]
MGIIAKPLAYLLMFIYKIVGNYGISLILLTLIVKVCLYPLYLKQIKSTAGMQNMQPKIQEIQQKYANDKERQNQELQKLYSESGFNPMGGCLPMIIQMPIIMGLFALLRNPMRYMPNDTMILAVHESFLWIKDLAQPDPWVLPVLAGLATYFSFSMTQNLTGQDMGQGQSMTLVMKYFFPVSILVLARAYPAGLAIYWAFGQAIQILLNLHMNSVRLEMKVKQDLLDERAKAEKELRRKKRARMKGNA